MQPIPVRVTPTRNVGNFPYVAPNKSTCLDIHIYDLYNENIIAILKVIPTMIRGVFYEKGSGDYSVGDVPFMRV